MLVAPIVLAHPGEPGDPLADPHRFEGERYVSSPDCDPNLVGAHVTTGTLWGRSAAVIPFWSCYLDYGPVTFTKYTLLSSIVGWFNNSGGSAVGNVTLYVDGVAHGHARFVRIAPETDWQVELATTPRWIAPGEHDVRIGFKPGGGSAAFWLDALVFETTDASCVNELPTPPTSFTADGYGATRKRGWIGHAYDFSAWGASDPEGDPLLYTWEFGEVGQTTSHAFATSGSRQFRVNVTDDPSARCPEASPQSVTSAKFVFYVSRDWTTIQPLQANHHACVGFARAYAVVAMIVHSCGLFAQVHDGSFTLYEADGLDRVSYFVDGVVVPPDTPYTASYRAIDHSPGTHLLDTCAYALDDKYGRAFCSPRWTYLNVG